MKHQKTAVRKRPVTRDLSPRASNFLRGLLGRDYPGGPYEWTRPGLFGAPSWNDRELTGLVRAGFVERRRGETRGAYEFRITSAGRKRIEAQP